MPSIFPGYEYDIFISYRQNDNRSGWTTEFVSALKEELAATLKDAVSIYFDNNPHDGLLETHLVGKSLEGKLKCLIFIPIISQTYCDPRSFAWNHEFCVFNQHAKSETLGRDITVSNGNVASRILPVKIHDLDEDDNSLIEKELGGPLRAVEFIYREPGVNRPLLPTDRRHENLSKTDYRNQVNKVANGIKEIIHSLRNGTSPEMARTGASQLGRKKSKKIRIAATILMLALSSAIAYAILQPPSFFLSSPKKNPRIAVPPFKSIGDPGGEYLAAGMRELLTKYLRNNRRISIPPSLADDRYLNTTKSHQEIVKELNADFIIEGSVLKAGESIQIIIKLIDPKKDEIPYTYDKRSNYSEILQIQEQIARGISKELGTTLPGNSKVLHLKNTEAIDPYLRGIALAYSLNFADSIIKDQRQLFRKSIEIDPEFAEAYIMLAASLLSQKEDFTDSIEHLFERGLEIYPTNNYGIARKCEFLFLMKKDTLGSFRLASETINKDPDNPDNIGLLAWLGFMYEYWLKDQREIRALPYYTKGYELDPDFFYSGAGTNHIGGTNHIAYMALFFCNMNDYDRGEYYLKEAIHRQPNFIWQKDMATLLYRSSQYEKLDKYVMGIGNSKNALFPDSLVWKAVACLHRGRYTEGLKAIPKFQLKERPHNFEQELIQDFYMEMTTYTLLLERSGRKPEARKIWQDVIDRELKSKQIDPVILSRCYAKLGEKEKALKYFDKIVFTHLTPLHNADYFSRDLMFETLWKEPQFVNKIQKEKDRLKGIRDRVADMETEKIIVLPRFMNSN
jgi:TolB-like protein